MKIRFLISLLTLLAMLNVNADLHRLDQVLQNRDSYVERKENRIDSIKNILSTRISREKQLQCYDDLYKEYLTFRFDSAMTYLDRTESIMDSDAPYDTKCQLKINRALSLATSGHFSQAIDILNSIDSKLLSPDTRENLYDTFQWTYGVWAEYSKGSKYANEYTHLSVSYLDSLLQYIDKSTPLYHYHYGDYLLRQRDYQKATSHFLKALDVIPQDSRTYAQAAYGLAIAYKELGDHDNYRKWLINAAISDQIIPLKENLALQELALDIKNTNGDLETANRYLKYSLEDAIFYNNRLRMLEISEKFPDIVIGYQETISSQNRRLKIFLICIGALLVILGVAVIVIVKEKREVGTSREALVQLNVKLKNLNDKLALTNASREHYVSLFMDLCAAYIQKLNRFQSTVILKIKARQFDDLLRVANNNARPSDAEMREIFFNFDTAFLKLYPDFISKFNSLLQPGKAILPKQNELLNTDLRIFALIRMGIKDSTKIATLLFYSPQTIFNRRTQVRNRAIDRETFESELMKICDTLPS